MPKPWLTALFSLCFLTSSAPALAERWTVLVYWAVDNDLYEFSIPYLRQFERVGSESGLNLVVETDYPGKRKSERTLILQNDGTPGRTEQDLPHSLILETLPNETRSARPRTLARFLAWGMKHFPAERYALVIGSHGMNWRGVIEDGSRNEVMSLTGLRSVLRQFTNQRGSPLDLLIFDACRMAFGETLHALRGSARWILGSQFDVNGFDHASPLQELRANPTLSGRELGELYVDHYPHTDAETPDFSAALLNGDPGTVTRFEQDVDLMADQILALPASDQAILRQQLSVTKNEYGDTAIDFAHLLNMVLRVRPDWETDLAEVRARSLPRESRVDAFGAAQYRNYSREAIIQAASSTRGSSPSNGVSLTCSSDPEKYALSPFGRKHPAWVAACSLLVSNPNQ